MSSRQGARAVAVGLASAAAAALGRRWWRARSGGGDAARSEWTCGCGRRFRFSGAGRHRVYWAEDAPPGQPVVGDRCPSCERPLPAGREAGVPAA